MPRKVTEEKTSAPLTEMREENRASAGDIPVICRRMRYYRLKQHIGQKELGLMIGASANTVNNWEMGRSRPDVSFLPAIIQALGISFEEIYGIRKPDEQIREEKRAEEEELLLKLYRKLDRGNKYAAERMIRTLLVVQKGNEQQRLRPVMELPLITRSLAAGVGDPTEFEENTEPFYLYRPDGGEEHGAGGPYAKRNAAERADCVFRVNGESMEPVYPDGCYVLVEKCSELKVGEIGAFSAGNELYIKEYQKDGLHSLNPRFETLTFADAACCVIGRVVGKAGELPSKEEIALYKAVEGER